MVRFLSKYVTGPIYQGDGGKNQAGKIRPVYFRVGDMSARVAALLGGGGVTY